MKATCISFGIHLSPLELDHFDHVQYQFFGKLVENGESISYPDDRPTPYKPVYAPGFPIAGTFGQIEKVVSYADPSKMFARKRLLHIEGQQKSRIEAEIRLLQKFRHQHSIPFHGMYTHQNQIFLIFDFADCNLDQFLKNPPLEFLRLPASAKASKIINWMIDISTALADFHAVGGIHRDLKPQNILIKGDRLMLADFGLATQFESSSAHVASVQGNEKYMAPEQGVRSSYGRSVDVFAMGCIYLELLSFARDKSLEYFDHFRRVWGNQSCDYSENSCYRHNLNAVSKFIFLFLRGVSMNLEPLVDLIEFELIIEKPVLRIAARDVRLRLLTISEKFDFFIKSDCCSASRKNPKFKMLV